MIVLTDAPIDPGKVLAEVQSPRAGASVLFVGTTRQFTGEQETVELHYEAYEAMANKELQKLVEEAEGRWPLTGCAVVHRLGEVSIGEASVAIAVSSPHRADAFAAGQWLIDALKQRAPIWKQERLASGKQAWIHPQPPSEKPV